MRRRQLVGALLTTIVLFPPKSIRAGDIPRFSPSEILVKFRLDRGSKPVAAGADSLARRVGVVGEDPLLPGRPLRAAKPAGGREGLERVVRIRLAPGTEVDAAIAAYQASGLVDYAQPNRLYRVLDAPSDPRFSEQWHLQAINWQAAWERSRALPVKKTPIVAITDSGVDYRHEDLASAIWTNLSEVNGRPGVDDDGNGYVDDIRGWDFTDAPGLPGSGDYLGRDNDPMDEGGHGTHVAGIAGAVTNNGVGISGVCPVGKIMALRAGFSLDGATYLEDDDLAASIAYAVENGADVINASWGDDDVSPVIRDAVGYAAHNGVIFVAAAGNDSRGSLGFPAALAEAISVAALDSQGRLASFSDYGERLDLAAPGVGILSTRVGGGYETRSGTSMAAPCVSGLAAWILAYHPEFSAEEVRSALKRTATDLGAPGRDASFGSGRIDASAALALPSAPVVQITSPASGFGLSGDADVRGLVAGGAGDYQLEWGTGRDPSVWSLIQRGRATGGNQVLGQFSVKGLPDTLYTLRVSAGLQDGTVLETRAVVSLDRTPPVFRWQRVSARLDSARTGYFVEWETDDRGFGEIRVRPPGMPEIQMEAPYIARVQSMRLPDDLPEGPTSVGIVSRNVSGLSSPGQDTTFTVRREAIPRSGFTKVATLPDGYLMDRASDFDGNGRPEIVLMPYVQGRPFSPVKGFEKGQGWDFKEVFTTPEAFLPWAAGNIAGNGRQVLMGAGTSHLWLYQGAAAGSWPTAKLAEDTNAWGGDLADLDGDGTPEILSRSGRQRELRVMKLVRSLSSGSPDTFGLNQVGLLADATSGTSLIGPHVATGDFDGDGRVEIVLGDSDGDLLVYEKQPGSLAFDQTWTERHPGSDARLVGGGADFDGDGRQEFILARTDSIPGDATERRWIISVYQSRGDNSYSAEWQTEILGGKAAGNGIAVGDVTGDGKPDFVICALPDIYVFSARGTDAYRPVWYAAADLTYAPLITDLDGNGRAEVVFNQGGAVRFYERDGVSAGPSPPGPISVAVLPPNRVLLTWTGSAGASYSVYRGLSADSLRTYAQGLDATTSTDTLSADARGYYYAVTSVDSSGRESRRSPVVSVPGRVPSPFRSATPLTPRLVAVPSLVPLDPGTAQEPRNYVLLPDSISPGSASLDQGGRRVVLGFELDLRSGGSYQILISGLKDTLGVPAGFPGKAVVSLTLSSTPPTEAFDLDLDGTVGLSDFFLFAVAFGGPRSNADFNGDGTVNLADFFLFAEAFGKRWR